MESTERSSHAIPRVLIIFPGALGDLMCVMPAIAAIARRHAGASIELMARGELARLAVGRTVVGGGHSIDAREVGELFSDGPLGGARRFFSQFERIYSFFAFDDARFRVRLSAATDGEVSFHPFRPVGEGHASEAYLRAIGEAGSSGGWRLEPTDGDLAGAHRVLARLGCGGTNLIVMFPGSGSAAKNWPVGKFVALANMLAKRAGILRSADSALNDRVDPAAVAAVRATASGILRFADFALNDNGDPAAVEAVPAKGSGILRPDGL